MNTKYPRTYHLPFSPEVHSDDKVLHDISNFIGKDIIITEKADGGNTCLSQEGVFARSHGQQTDCPTFDYIKNIHYFSKKHMMNHEYKYYGENLYAIHSIVYTNLKDYFYLFGISDKEKFLSYFDMVKEATRMGFKSVPVVFRGIFETEKKLKDFLDDEIKKDSYWGGEREGFVIRTPNEFPIEDFSENVVKYVRKGHVQSDKHWKENWKKQELNKSI